MISLIIEEFRNTQSGPSEGARERLAATMAGVSAIQYGKALSQSEMEDLFDALFACRAPNYSPKGKQVINILTLEDLDKKFR
jgi:DNA mismatch repair protein MutL